jgi:hypothetical protein
LASFSGKTFSTLCRIDRYNLADVLKMLNKEGLIDDKFIVMILKWRHTSGFSIGNGVSPGTIMMGRPLSVIYHQKSFFPQVR